ncbi:MAG: hypothetical protein AAGH15_24055 [Myxococcota bacterium]
MRAPERLPQALPPLAFALALAIPGSAHAYEEQWTLELDAGYARALPGGEAAADGAQLGVTASWGPSDLFALRGRASYGFHPAPDPLHVALVGAEVVYLLDILEWVPYFGAGVDAFVSARAGRTRGNLGLHAVVGLDYLPRRDLLFGIEARAYVLPTGFGDGAFEPAYLSGGLKVGWLFAGY